MKFYRIEDYKGDIPNPKSFLVKDSTIITIKGHPTIFSDGFMIDVKVRQKDADKLRRHSTKEIKFDPIVRDLLAEAGQCSLELSEPKYVLDDNLISYGMTHSDTEIKFIQAKYYRYFSNRYPKCQFLVKSQKDSPHQLVAVKQWDYVVGVVMLILFRRTVAEVEKELQ